ncbi:hypothetical protein C0993_003717, partial [Termitomyces sp. T159_Od127]
NTGADVEEDIRATMTNWTSFSRKNHVFRQFNVFVDGVSYLIAATPMEPSEAPPTSGWVPVLRAVLQVKGVAS